MEHAEEMNFENPPINYMLELQLQETVEKTPSKRCECGLADIYPGEDLCHFCLGIAIADHDSYIGSEEWKQEMRHFWPKMFPTKESK